MIKGRLSRNAENFDFGSHKKMTRYFLSPLSYLPKNVNIHTINTKYSLPKVCFDLIKYLGVMKFGV